jgi:hypothetical protein
MLTPDIIQVGRRPEVHPVVHRYIRAAGLARITTSGPNVPRTPTATLKQMDTLHARATLQGPINRP